MKKIIAAFDSLKFSTSTRDYSLWLARENSAHLAGVFLEDHASFRTYDLLYERGGLAGSARRKLSKKDSKARAVSVKNFENACQTAGLDYSIYHDRKNAIQDLLLESMYADLVVIDSSETLANHPEKTPTSFVRDLLYHIQCPVLVVPHLFKPADRLALLYDGQPGSVHAIKMLTYVLPSITTLPAEVISVNDPGQSPPFPVNNLMNDLMKRNFPNASFTALSGLAEPVITNHLKKQKVTPLVVLGAYRRSTVSRWFRSSMADVLMNELNLPLFIAHTK